MSSLSRFVDGLVHPSLAGNPLEALRHRNFLSANLIGGLLALALLPVYVAVWGKTDIYIVIAFGWIAAQAPIALFLSRTGQFETACILLAAAFSGLIGWVTAITGGTASFALFWLLLVPAEAALSGSRRVVGVALAIALSTASVVVLAEASSSLPPVHAAALPGSALQFIALIGGVAYAAWIAFRADVLQRQTERMVRLREERYRLVAQNMTDIVSLHSQDGDVVFVTPAVQRVLGVDVAAAHNDGFFKQVHVADRPAFLKTLSDSMAGKKSSSVEFRALRKHDDGRPANYVWLEMRCQPLGVCDPMTGIAETIAVTRDITARKEQEDKLRQAQEAAELACATKTRFLANVSHELRTPLNAIIGFSEILSQREILGSFDEEQHLQYAKLIHESGHHLLQVVSDILDMSKIESGNFEIVPDPFEIAGLVEGCRQMMSQQADERGVALTTELSDNLPELVADSRACKQILLNLLSNAVKFTDRGGDVVLGARREGTRVAFYVRDTGIGIASEDLPKLGSAFFQADSGYDRRHEGTGLGLSVVKGLVELHRGTLDIQSRLNAGTTVTIYLPINCEAAAEPILPAREQDRVTETTLPADAPVRKTA